MKDLNKNALSATQVDKMTVIRVTKHQEAVLDEFHTNFKLTLHYLRDHA